MPLYHGGHELSTKLPAAVRENRSVASYLALHA
jgi:hypothetical protein